MANGALCGPRDGRMRKYRGGQSMIRMTGKAHGWRDGAWHRLSGNNTRREDVRVLGSQHLWAPISYVVGRVLGAINQPAPFHVATRTPWNVIIYGRSLAWQQFRNVSSRHLRDSVWPLWIRVIAFDQSGNHRWRNHDCPWIGLSITNR